MTKKLLIVFTCLCAVFITPGRTSRPARSSNSDPPSIIAIVDGTLIDGSGRAPLRDSVVIIEGDHIKAVGTRKRVKVPEAARVIDARGLAVAPGFIDIHNHSQAGLDTDPAAVTQVSQGITTLALGRGRGRGPSEELEWFSDPRFKSVIPNRHAN